jgi:hypothetical protein
MKIIVAHNAPDLDAVTSIWLIKRFLPGWEDAQLEFVPAGTRLERAKPGDQVTEPIEKYGDDEVIHVDTGLGPLDHHQTSSDKVCGASLTWDFVRENSSIFKNSEGNEKIVEKEQAISRLVQVVVDVDHFKEVFWPDPNADYFEFLLTGIIDGIKLGKPNDDKYCAEFSMESLDYILYSFENRIWAEEEIRTNSKEFESKWGKGLALETINDDVIKLAQKSGFAVVLRKDPRKGYVRIKASPASTADLTNTYEQLKKMDPEATWFLHASKKMLLNGTPKNPKMKPTSLSLDDIISVLKK